ncbi:MAG TPA: ABC transporter permease, partial [bacterium]|nr:ABC transporter permease [bacterium]
DKGGRIIYKGKPLDAISYFKRNAFYPQPDERECPECGSLNPEIVFKIIEDKKLDGAGEYGSERKNSAEEWQNLYQKNFPDSQKRIIVGKPLPINNASKKPSVFKQLKIFCGRNFRIKTANRQYMFTILLQTPLLALIVAYFTKYVSAQGYNFNSNKHLPFYIFMTAIVSLFSGMTTSAEEIIKDRSVLKREEFLNLSWGSYLNSKIIFLLGASAIQALLYIIIGNSILAIKGQFLLYWLIFFSSSCAANMIGLNLSNALNSAAAIYILIPLILIPQILLGGLIIEFDDMPFKMKTDNNVSFIGNLTTSRWAYEALAVGQFKYNGYQKFFFDVEKNIWDYLYYGDLLIPELKRRLNAAAQNKKPLKEEDIHIIQNEIKELRGKFPSLNLQNQIDNYDKTIQELESARSKIKYLRNVSERKKDKLLNDLQIKFGSGNFDDIRKKFSNDALSNIVKKSGNGEFYRETSERLVRLCAPVYKEPQSEIGGAHFYSAEKKVFDYYLETPFFNAAIIWIQAFV